MTNLIIAATKDEAAALRGQADSVVRTLEDVDGRRTLRGRTFDRLTFTADANQAATDEQRDTALSCITGESSGRP